MPRAYWNGFLKLSFVSCPVALYPATTAAERVSFRQVNRRTGHRLKHQLLDSITGEAVDTPDKGRGYEVGENRFLVVEDRELEQARSERPPPGAVQLAQPLRPAPATRAAESEESEETGEEQHREEVGEEKEQEDDAAPLARPQNTRTIEIERFIPVGQVDVRYFEKPYYVAPRDAVGQESFAVIRDAMSRKNVAALARVVLSSRERPILVAPMGTGLCGVTLRFAHEVRREGEYFSGIPEMKLPAEMVKLAQHIIETKSADFDPTMLEDHYRNALVRILKKKQAKTAPPAPIAPSRENVINLMDALKRSIAAEPLPKKPAAASTAARKKRRNVPPRKA